VLLQAPFWRGRGSPEGSYCGPAPAADGPQRPVVDHRHPDKSTERGSGPTEGGSGPLHAQGEGVGGEKHGGERGRDAAIRREYGGYVYYLPSEAAKYPGAPCFPGPGPRLRARSQGRDEVGRRVDGLGGG
jgi:hypothetical protein